MKKLYKWECYFGRMGSLDSVFIADDEFIQSIIGATAMFGEVLGKHSDISCILASDQFEVKSENQLVIQELEEIFGKDELEFYSKAFLELNKLNTEVTTLSGYNPITQIEGEDFYDEDDE